MSKRQLPSYGEAWFQTKEKVNSIEVKFDDCVSPVKCMPRMSKVPATAYYSKKCETVFDNLGMTKKISNLEPKFPQMIKEVMDQTKKILQREARKINREYLKLIAQGK